MGRKELIKLMLTDEERKALFDVAEANGVTVSQMVELLLVTDKVYQLIEEYYESE